MGTRYRGKEEIVAALDAFIKLTRAAESVSARVHGYLAGKGTTITQFGVLEMLLHLGPLPQREIGRRLLRSSGNMTLVIDNLEKQGLVRRERQESDRRFFLVHLTAEGREFIEKLFPEHAEKIAGQMQVLTREEMDELGRLCKKLGTGSA